MSHISKLRTQRLKKILLFSTLSAFAAIVLFCYFWQKPNYKDPIINEREVQAEKEDINKKEIKTAADEQKIEPFEKGTRRVEYKNIYLPAKTETAEYIDLRISYKNGMDFLILPKKQLLSLEDDSTGSTIQIYITEEELLKMSDAVCDVNKFEGSYLYGTLYPDKRLDPAKADYPVSLDMNQLLKHDPNVEIKEQSNQSAKLRKKLENDLVVMNERERGDFQTESVQETSN